jgi:hypothetical protein
MVSTETVRLLALAYPETDEYMHFDKPAFRVKKKIFATVHIKEKRVVAKLSLTDQSVFCAVDATIIYPVPGGWGKKGWTMIELTKVKKSMFKDLLNTAYCTVAPKKLAEKFISNYL